MPLCWLLLQVLLVHSWYMNHSEFESLIPHWVQRDDKKLNTRLDFHFYDLDKFIRDECPSLLGIITTDSIARLAVVLSRLDQKIFDYDYFTTANNVIKKNLKRYEETAIYHYDGASALSLSDGANRILGYLRLDEAADRYPSRRVPIEELHQLPIFRSWSIIILDEFIGELRMKDKILYHNNDTEISLIGM